MLSGVTIFSITGCATEVLFSSLDLGNKGEILILIPYHLMELKTWLVPIAFHSLSFSSVSTP
jgi:hypothetical protein